MKPYTEHSMQIDMDHLFTELTLENITYTPKGPKGTTVSDYRDLFNEDLPLKEQIKSDVKSKEKGLHPAKKMCIRVGKSRKKAKKILIKGEPGTGKTTIAKKMALDWARGVFTTFSIVLFVFLKLVSPGDPIENVVIKQNPWIEGLNVKEQDIKNILNIHGRKCLLILDGLDECPLGKNEDVPKIIKGQKFLDCNKVITSRPHKIKAIKKHFDAVIEIQGFARDQAYIFASKIISDKSQIDAILRFDSNLKLEFTEEPVSDDDNEEVENNRHNNDSNDDFVEGDDSNDEVVNDDGNNEEFINAYGDYDEADHHSHLYKNPILLSFLCILAQYKEIDFSKTLSFGEIYYGMIRCLFMKYVRRQDDS